jgi:alkyl sulfatase BDS1-like metallo-beta-lactamase superfamily hydrolase
MQSQPGSGVRTPDIECEEADDGRRRRSRGAGRYMGDEVTLVTAPNGAVTNTDAAQGLAALSAPEPATVELAPGVHSIVGLALFNIAVIEGATGLIVYDTGDSVEDGEMVLEHIRTISDKPIAGVIYSHSHYAFGASALIGDADVPVIGHPNVNRNVAAASGGAIAGVFSELAPLYQARLAEQVSNFLPDEGPDATVAGKIVWKENGFVPVNREVADGEEFELDGVRMQAFTEYWSDEDACLTLYLPDHGVVLNNIFLPFMPNLYPLRGDAFRDPRTWRDGIGLIRDLEPSALHNTHGLPMVGGDMIAEALQHYMDGITFIFDQTLRGMLKGLGPEELRTFVRLPDHLREFPQLAEVYGEVQFFPPRIYVEALGWFDRDAANIFPPPPEFEAERIVAGFGGRDAVVSAVERALDDEEWAWAARLVNYLFRLDPRDVEVRSLKARALREMGRRALGSIARAFLLGQARALEGEVSIPTVVVPDASELSQGDIASLVDNFRVFVDPDRSADVDLMLHLEFTDADDATLALIVRRGVCEFVADPAAHPREPDLSCSLTRLTWAKLFTGEATARELAASGELEAGGQADAVVKLLDVFDPFDAAHNESIPPPRPAGRQRDVE